MLRRIQSSFRPTALVLACSMAAANAQSLRIAGEERAELRLRQPQRIVKATALIASEKTRLQLGEDHSFKVAGAVLGQNGDLHTRFRQFYKNVRVFESDMIVQLDRGDNAKRTTHSLLTGFQLDVEPQIAKDEAVRKVLGGRDPEPNAVVETELVVVKDAETVESAQLSRPTHPELANADAFAERVRGANLAWLISIDEPGKTAMTYLLDSHAGNILRQWEAEQNDDYTPVTATGQGQYVGNVNFAAGRKTQLANPFDNRFWIIDPSRNGNRVMNVDNVAGATGAMYGAPDPAFGDGEDYNWETMSSWSPTGQTMGVDLAYSMQKIWDLLFHKFDREGLDGNGFAMVARAHARKETDKPYGDAYWSSTAKAAHFGDGSEPTSGSLTRPFWIAHEFGHGMWHFALGGVSNSGEAGGLNEGNSDIQGAIVNFYLNEPHPAYELPETGDVGNFASRMTDPNSYKSGQGRAYWQPGMGDLEVHVQGCALGHMFVFLVQGSSANPAHWLHSVVFPDGMAGIGLRKAAEIWYEAITGHLSGAPTFSKMRTAYLDAAEDLFGMNSLEYKAVQNAFAAINVGGKAVDAAKPDVSLSNPIDNELERSLFVIANATDDVAVVKMELLIDGAVKKTVKGLPNAKFVGYLDIANLSPGSHTVKAIAYDAAGKQDEQSRNFSISGVNQLILNGGFESGAASWEESSDSNYGSDAALSFLGSRFALLNAGAWVRQKVTLPATANAATLSYRLRIAPYNLPGDERLFVQFVSTTGTLLETIAAHSGDFPTNEDAANDYKYFSFGLPASLIGKTVYVRFLSTALLPGRFRVDNVSLVWSGTVSAKLTVDVDENEGSVSILVSDLVNVSPQTLKLVRLVVNGQQVGGDAFAPYMVVWPTSEFVKNATYKVRAEMVNYANVKIGQTAEVSFLVHEVDQRVKNQGFESGSQFWAHTGGTKFGQNAGEAQIYWAFLGNRFAYFDGTTQLQTLYQQVYVPKADTAQLSFRVRVDAGNVKEVADNLQVRILDTNGQVLKVLDNINATVDTHQAANWNGFAKKVYSLSQYTERMIRVEFRCTQTAGNPTRFIVDNVSVTAKSFGLAGN